MKILWLSALLVMTLTVALVIAGQAGLLSGKVPHNLGVRHGQLRPPSPTPNSVSSQAALYPNHPQRHYADIAPLAYSGDGDQAMIRLATVLRQSKCTIVGIPASDYIYAQCSTTLLKFTDDVEFWLDRQNNVIHVRSASRVGRNDFGVNRARVETIRARLSN